MSNEFRYKPISESKGTLTVLLPTSLRGNLGAVRLIGPNGEVIEEGRFRHDNHNGNRPTYDFSQPGYSYPPGVRVVAVDDSGREVFNQEGASGLKGGEVGPGGSGAGSYGGPFGTTPGGNNFAIPGFVNYNGLHTPYIDYKDALADAEQLGDENRETYFKNITGDQAKNAALGLIDTDIEGIERGLDRLAPRARAEGDLDTQTNIRRAGEIDEFNLDRIPTYNAVNQRAVAASNQFNQAERAKAVESSGLDFRQRTTKLLDQLDQQSEGRLSDDLDKSLTASIRNRGAEQLGATGIGPISGAGVRVQDRLEISERMGIQANAQAMIPGVLTQAQQVLMSPEERAPTIYASPTAVPLNTSNIQDRVPVQANLSAGQAQLNIGSTATEIETIDAENSLGKDLNSRQFNEQAKYTRDLTVMDRTQGQLNTSAGVVQGAINADKADEIRAQAFDSYNQGLGQQISSGNAQAQGLNNGFAGGVAASQPGGVFGGISSGLAGIGAIAQGIGNVVSGLSGGSGGTPSGTTTVGNTQVPGSAVGGFMQAISDWWNGGSGENTGSAIPFSGSSGGGGGGAPIGSAVSPSGGAGTFDASGEVSEPSTEVAQSTTTPDTQNVFQRFGSAVSDLAVDAQLVDRGVSTVTNWDQYTPEQRLSNVTQLGIGVLEGHEVISPEQAQDLRSVGNSLSVLANSNATDAERGAAVAQLGTRMLGTTYTGSPNSPTSIGGRPVVGNSTTADGSPAYMVQGENGEVTTVPRSQLTTTANVASAVSAFSVLTSNASTEDKLTALGALGIQSAAANNIINQVASGNIMAGLSIFNTAQNWEEMTPIQQAVAVAQTGGAIVNTAAQFLGQSGAQIATQTSVSGASGAAAASTSSATASAATAGGSTGLATAGTVLGGAAIIGGAILGIDTAADTISAADDMPRSQSQGSSTMGGAAAGAGIGAAVAVGGAIASGATAGAAVGSYVPIVGTVVGAAVGAALGFAIGSSGSGKNTGQHMRDSWRGSMEELGLATKNENGSHEVTLADGTKYDIGKDGGALLDNKGINIDGRDKRFTYDVDWSNDAAVASIPEAHIFAIATGLDPTDANKMDLFHRAVGQSLNAATSNTSDVSGVRENFKAMMQGKVDPRELAMRIETLRVGNKVTDEEYNVYLNSINNMFGTKIQPTDRKKATEYIIGKIQSYGDKAAPWDKELLETLQSPEKLAKAQAKLEERMEREKKGGSKPRKQEPVKPVDRNAGRPPVGANIPGLKDPNRVPISSDSIPPLEYEFANR